jgi:hypothetical protein
LLETGTCCQGWQHECVPEMDWNYAWCLF